MLALSGGIGAGKSTLAHALRGLGAHIVDADVLAREVLSPEHPVYEAVLANFGSDLVGADGVLDRQLFSIHSLIQQSLLWRTNVLRKLETESSLSMMCRY